MSNYEPKRGDLVEVVHRTDEWSGLRGIVEGVEDDPGIAFYRIVFPEFEVDDGPSRWAHFMADQLRPLVVLDLANNAHAVNALRDTLPCDEGDRDAQDWLVAQIADQIEAQVKPPRIPEPGLWGVVEAINSDAGGKRTWVRRPENGAGNEWVSDTGCWRCWSELIDPTLIREGLS